MPIRADKKQIRLVAFVAMSAGGYHFAYPAACSHVVGEHGGTRQAFACCGDVVFQVRQEHPIDFSRAFLLGRGFFVAAQGKRYLIKNKN